MYCLCVNVYCHRVTTQLQLINKYIKIYIKPRSISAKIEGVRAKTRTSYFDDVSLEVTTTLACSICSVKVNKSVNRKLRSSMRKDHVSETTVKTRAWESIELAHKCSNFWVLYEPWPQMFGDRFTCGYDDASQGSDIQDILSRATHNKRQRLINEQNLAFRVEWRQCGQ
jgi:hypothetical protein